MLQDFFVSVLSVRLRLRLFLTFRGRQLPLSAAGFFSFLFPLCFPLLLYRSPGRLSEMRQETFSPKRRVILYQNFQTRSKRTKTAWERTQIEDLFTSSLDYNSASISWHVRDVEGTLEEGDSRDYILSTFPMYKDKKIPGLHSPGNSWCMLGMSIS